MSTIKVDTITDEAGTGAPTFSQGAAVTGNLSATGTITGSSAITTDNLTVGTTTFPTAGALSNRNLIINGSMIVAQRANASSVGSTGIYGPDRFGTVFSVTSMAADISQDIDAPQGFGSSFKYETSTARTGTSADEYTGIAYYAEIQDVIPYFWAGNSHVTASFWVKSSIAGDFAFNINVDETNSGYSGDRVLYHSLYTINAVNTWEYKTVTIPLSFLDSYALLSGYAGVSRGLEVTWVVDLSSGGTRDDATLGWNNTEARNFATSSGGGADTGFFDTVGATFQITGVQLELGDTATPFEHRSYGDELQRCQRYYYRVEGGAAAFCRASTSALFNNATSIRAVFQHPVYMRAVPTLGHTAMSTFDIEPFDQAPSSFVGNNGTIRQSEINVTSPTSRTTGFAAALTIDDANGYIEWDAEL